MRENQTLPQLFFFFGLDFTKRCVLPQGEGERWDSAPHIGYLNKNALLIFRDASVFNTWKVPSKYLKKIQTVGSLMNFFFS